jgi:hypothetical protein
MYTREQQDQMETMEEPYCILAGMDKLEPVGNSNSGIKPEWFMHESGNKWNIAGIAA